MKLILLFTIIISNVCFSKDNNMLIDLVKVIRKESSLIQKTCKENDCTNKIRDFYQNYFFDGNNIFASSIDNMSDEFNCGFLYLKVGCSKQLYKMDALEIDETTSCVNIYGTQFIMPNEYMVQNTILFKKNLQGEWKIIGNRSSFSSLKLIVYGLLKNKPLDKNFTHWCYNSKKIQKRERDLKKNMKNFDLRYHNSI